VTTLVQAKADVRTANKAGGTPLQSAADNDAQAVVVLLLEVKAEVHDRSR
jgi:ankyrin repeat protein